MCIVGNMIGLKTSWGSPIEAQSLQSQKDV